MSDTEKKIEVTVQKNIINDELIRKMSFIYKAIHNGWTVHIEDGKYVFIKKHNGKREVFEEDYLVKFIKTNISL